MSTVKSFGALTPLFWWEEDPACKGLLVAVSEMNYDELMGRYIVLPHSVSGSCQGYLHHGTVGLVVPQSLFQPHVVQATNQDLFDLYSYLGTFECFSLLCVLFCVVKCRIP